MVKSVDFQQFSKPYFDDYVQIRQYANKPICIVSTGNIELLNAMLFLLFHLKIVAVFKLL